MWKRQSRYVRPKATESDFIIPDEDNIVAMTKGEDNVPVRIGDFFAHKNEAYLTSKMLSSDKDFDKVFANLVQDLKRTTGQYRGRDLRYDWTLTIDEFVSLTPYFKPFFHGCTRDSMRLLLLQTRRDVLKLCDTDPHRHSKRRHSLGTEPVDKEINCKNADRLTPLSEDVYSHFVDLLVLTRLGSNAHNSLSIFLRKDKAWQTNYLLPVISDKIELTFKGSPVFRNSWMAFLDESHRRSSSKLQKLAEVEKRTKKVR